MDHPVVLENRQRESRNPAVHGDCDDLFMFTATDIAPADAALQ